MEVLNQQIDTADNYFLMDEDMATILLEAESIVSGERPIEVSENGSYDEYLDAFLIQTGRANSLKETNLSKNNLNTNNFEENDEIWQNINSEKLAGSTTSLEDDILLGNSLEPIKQQEPSGDFLKHQLHQDKNTNQTSNGQIVQKNSSANIAKSKINLSDGEPAIKSTTITPTLQNSKNNSVSIATDYSVQHQHDKIQKISDSSLAKQRAVKEKEKDKIILIHNNLGSEAINKEESNDSPIVIKENEDIAQNIDEGQEFNLISSVASVEENEENNIIENEASNLTLIKEVPQEDYAIVDILDEGNELDEPKIEADISIKQQLSTSVEDIANSDLLLDAASSKHVEESNSNNHEQNSSKKNLYQLEVPANETNLTLESLAENKEQEDSPLAGFALGKEKPHELHIMPDWVNEVAKNNIFSLKPSISTDVSTSFKHEIQDYLEEPVLESESLPNDYIEHDISESDDFIFPEETFHKLDIMPEWLNKAAKSNFFNLKPNIEFENNNKFHDQTILSTETVESDSLQLESVYNLDAYNNIVNLPANDDFKSSSPQIDLQASEIKIDGLEKIYEFSEEQNFEDSTLYNISAISKNDTEVSLKNDYFDKIDEHADSNTKNNSDQDYALQKKLAAAVESANKTNINGYKANGSLSNSKSIKNWLDKNLNDQSFNFPFESPLSSSNDKVIHLTAKEFTEILEASVERGVIKALKAILKDK